MENGMEKNLESRMAELEARNAKNLEELNRSFQDLLQEQKRFTAAAAGGVSSDLLEEARLAGLAAKAAREGKKVIDGKVVDRTLMDKVKSVAVPVGIAAAGGVVAIGVWEGSHALYNKFSASES